MLTISIPNLVINISNTNQNLSQMAHTIDELIAEVAKTQTLEEGAKTLIAGLRQKVADAIANAGTGISDAELAAIQAKVDETFTKLAASNTDFAGALVENTPASGTTDGGTTTPPVVETPAPTTGDTTGTDTTGGVVSTPVDATPSPTTDVPATPAEPTPVVDASGPSTVDPNSSVPAAPAIDTTTGGTVGAPPPPSL